jgi:hypothetical protein
MEGRRTARAASKHDGKEVDRNLPDIDLEVLQKGFGFLTGLIRNPLPREQDKLHRYVQEVFNVEMRTLPRPATDSPYAKINGTTYSYDVWVMQRVAEFIASGPSIDVARRFYRPILDLGAPGRYWVEDFLQAWITVGLLRSTDLPMFATIWGDMVEYAMSLPLWKPSDNNYWSPTETLAIDLMGLHERAATVLGRTEYRSVVIAMAPVFEQWANAWLKYGSVAAWFARFLPSDSGRLLLAQGIKKLATVINSFRPDDWHRYGLGTLFTEAIAACWKHMPHDVESQQDLRVAFLKILTELSARQIPEALHLRSKIVEVIAGA